MTTDRHEQILARLDRVIELLEDIRHVHHTPSYRSRRNP